MVGSAVLRVQVRVSSPTMHLTPVLLDVAPDGSEKVITRGFQHVDYRNGLDGAEPKVDKWIRVDVRLLPQDYTLAEGHRIKLLVQSSNTVWAVPGNPGNVDVADGRLGKRWHGSSLRLPTLTALG
jgi:predicted acyl esterase